MDGLKSDPQAVWPTTGEMVELLSRKIRIRDGARNQRHDLYANVFGMNYAELMRTNLGRAAMKAGKPNEFLQRVMAGDYSEQELRSAKAYVSAKQVDEAMRSPAGQHALGAGYGPSFMHDLIKGFTTVVDGKKLKFDAKVGERDWYKTARSAALKERLVLAAQLRADDCSIAPDVKGSQAMMLASLGESVVEKNQQLVERFS